jgi:hypothetical protein
MTEVLDKESYQAVAGSKMEHENIETSGWRCNDELWSLALHPTRPNVLRGASAIRKYFDYLNDPIACKLGVCVDRLNYIVSIFSGKSQLTQFLSYSKSPQGGAAY